MSRSTGCIKIFLCWVTLSALLAACAPSTTLTKDELMAAYRERVVVQQDRGITVSAAVPSAEETRALFDIDLYEQNIQPVWLKIENRRDEPVMFLPVGLDPQYYSPLEAAGVLLPRKGKVTPKTLVNRFFLEQSIDLRVEPGETLSGFIFSRLDEGTKNFNVDVAWENDFATFPFFIQVPGLAVDHYEVDWDALYPAADIVELDDEELVRFLEGFQCCVTNKAGTDTGDPMNLVVIGHPLDVYIAFIRAGWDETETVTRESAWKTMRSFFSGGEYRYSPVSSLYAFERAQDVALQKARSGIHERNHLRLWMSPVRYQGYPVWIGQISRDIGVRFTRKTITTHKIDPDVDETREYLLEDLVYAQTVRRFGYVKGVGAVAMDSPRGNLTGDPWFTDGFRLVVWVTREPSPLSRLRALPWRDPHSENE